MRVRDVVTSKGLLLVFFALISAHLLHLGYAQVTVETQIPNSHPAFSLLQTYTRYDSSTDNFPIANFSICIGESNRTVYLRMIAEDQNSNQEITNGGNVTWKLVEVINGTDTNVSSFTDFREPVFESTLGTTQLSYTDNVTLSTNKSTALFKIIANVADSSGNFTVNTSFFTLQKTSCIRVEENATLVASDPFEIAVDYCHLDIVVEENVTGRIIITLHNQSPVDPNVQTALDKYMTVDVEGTILQETINLSLLANYTQQEIVDKQLDEGSLRIYKWGSWNLQEGAVDADSNTVNFIINESTLANQSYRLGTYSVRGDPEGTQSPASGSGSSGGGGGGGGAPTVNVSDPLEPPEKPPASPPDQDSDPPPLLPELTPPPLEPYNQTTGDLNRTILGEGITEFLRLWKQADPLGITCPVIILILLVLYLRERKKNRKSEKEELLMSAKKIREAMRREMALFESLRRVDEADEKRIRKVLDDIDKLKQKRKEREDLS